LGALSLTLGSTSESSAVEDDWSLRVFSSGTSLVSASSPSPVKVGSNGTFTLPGVPCPGGTFTVSGTISGTQVTATFSGTGCTPILRRPGRVSPGSPPPAFDDLEIGFLNSDSIVVITGSRVSQGKTNPLRQARDLVDVAILTTTTQNRNIGFRMNSLRSGQGGGVSVSGLSLAVNGEAVPIGSMLGGASGGASADSSSPFGRLGIFANGQGSFGDRAETEKVPGLDFYTAGLTLGTDYRFTDQFILGAAFGYLRTKLDREGAVSDSTINGYSLSLYGTYYLKDRYYVDTILTYGRNNYDLERRAEHLTASTTTTLDTITARTDGDQLSASAGAGYDFSVGGLTFGPTGRMTYIRAHVDGYSERGPSGSNAVKVPSQTVESLTTALGGQLRYVINTSWSVLQPQVRAEWEHEFKGNTGVLAGTLLSDPSTILTAQPTTVDRDYFNLGVGITATFPRGVAAFLHYEEQIGRANFTNHSFTGGMRFEF
jgi:uncharacterized protein YhjY with autotransporter beta-barrel domain